MTGRRLYDLVCDGWSKNGDWIRARGENTLLPKTPIAWPFLSQAERSAFTHAASKIKSTKRKP